MAYMGCLPHIPIYEIVRYWRWLWSAMNVKPVRPARRSQPGPDEAIFYPAVRTPGDSDESELQARALVPIRIQLNEN